MTDIDWSKAPEGATHYLAENKKHGWFACWYKYGSNEWLCMSDSNRHEWIADNDDVELFEPMLIKRPAPSWNGEGLPPVGIECKVMHGTYGWIGAKVVGRVGSTTVIRTNDGYAGVHPHEIRPIRTPEKIAADERESAIKAIVGLIESADSRDMTIAEAIYNAGYRKP